MKKGSTKKQEMTIGLDLGDRYTHFCEIDSKGEIRKQGKFITSHSAFEERFASSASHRIALEVGAHSPWVSRLLQSLGHQVLVANARRIRLIYENPQKNDALDAQYLARIARLDPELLYPIHHRSAQTQADLALLRTRDLLVRSRAQWVCYLKGAVKSFGIHLNTKIGDQFAVRVRGQIPMEMRPALEPILTLISTLHQQIKHYDREVERLIQQRYPQASRLRQVSGIGPITALCFILTLEDPTRFRHSRKVGTFLGLCPRSDISCSQNPQLRISKAGDAFLRRLLVNCAQQILGRFGKDSDLRRWGLERAKRGDKNAKKCAVVGVARKLAVLLHQLWLSGQDYDPLYNQKRQKQALRVGA